MKKNEFDSKISDRDIGIKIQIKTDSGGGDAAGQHICAECGFIFTKMLSLNSHKVRVHKWRRLFSFA